MSRETKHTDEQLREILEQDIVATNGHVLLYGPPGTGKTTLAMKCAQPGQQVTEVTMRTGEGDFRFFGQLLPETDEKGNQVMRFADGPAKRAAQRGDLLVINEINHMSEDISNRMHMLGDHWSVAQDTLPTGEVVRISPNFRIIANMNGIPLELVDAVRDRFSFIAHVAIPSQAMLDRLDADVRELCLEKYKEADPISGPTVTYRSCLNFCATRLALGDDSRAAHRTFGERDQAIAFMEGLAMIKAKLARQAEDVAMRISALISHIHQQTVSGKAAANIGAAISRIAKLVLRAEYEKMLAED